MTVLRVVVVALMSIVSSALAGTISFSFNMAGTITGTRSADGTEDFPILSAPFSGTLPPFGNATANIAHGPVTGVLTITLANGSTITSTVQPQPGMPLTAHGTGTITGGTGVFANATGTYSFVVAPPASFTSIPTNLVVPLTLTGSGSITAPEATGQVRVYPRPSGSRFRPERPHRQTRTSSSTIRA